MASTRSKTSLGRLHFQNANILKDNAKEIEATFKAEDTRDVPLRKTRDHRAYCYNSILSIMSFVEAQANEFVDDLQEDKEQYENGQEPQFYPDISAKHRNKITSSSNLDNRMGGASPPIKYNVLLDVLGLDEFERDEEPIEPVLLLNKLRNELTHFSPEWVEGGPKTYTENEYGFEEDLKGRFDLNPIAAEGNGFFPDQCMSYGCVEWAIRNSRSLIYHFGVRVDVDMRAIPP